MVTIGTVELEVGDRVAVIRKEGLGESIRKARVASVDGNLIGVTFAKDELPTMYNRAEVFPLYRGQGGGIVLCGVPQNVPAHLS